jgi:predicted short-subunit dehydrogenase-like oxidoreductase (DUF2520 family)
LLTLNIVGAGRVGQTLGRLLHHAQLVEIGGVVARDLSRAKAACDFIGAGVPLADTKACPASTITLISTPDGEIASVCATLCMAGVLTSGSVVFHVSGAHSSEILASAAAAGAATASIHPVKAFASPQSAAASFAGTPCGYEGSAAALSTLEPLFRALGAQTFKLSAQHKVLYHAAAVMASNYVTTLADAALALYAAAGVDAERATDLVRSIATDTLSKALELGPANALTGPIARGDVAIVDAHRAALEALDDDTLGVIYDALGRRALAMAKRTAAVTNPELEQLAQRLTSLRPEPNAGPNSGPNSGPNAGPNSGPNSD